MQSIFINCRRATTALDVTIQAQILHLMKQLNEQFGTAIMMITHDLGVVAEMCHRVVVMYAGKIIEEGDVQTIFEIQNIHIRLDLFVLFQIFGKEKHVYILFQEAYRSRARLNKVVVLRQDASKHLSGAFPKS